MRAFKITGIGLAAMVALAGCVDPNTMSEEERELLRRDDTMSGSFGSGSADFSNATRANFASQVVDPAPAYAEDPPRVDGQVVIGGYGRYRTNKVKPPQAIGDF